MSPAPTTTPGPAHPPKSRRRFPLVAVAIVAVVLLGLVAIVATRGGGDDDNEDATATMQEQAPVTITGTPLSPFDGTAADPAVGRPAPVVKGVTFEGAPSQAGGTGQQQLLVFVAHWCPHCNREVPRLVSWMADGGVPEGTAVTAVVTGTNDAAPNYPPSAWLASEGWQGSVLVDDTNFSAGDAYGLTSYPYMVLLAADGTVIRRVAGELSPADLDALVAPATPAT